MTHAGGPVVRQFADGDALARAAAAETVEIARASVAARGVCHMVLSGGTTPRRMFEVLAAMGPTALPWERIELWWSDERTVAPDDPDSNYGMARDALIAPLSRAIDASKVHRIVAEQPPNIAAQEYERLILATVGNPPIFDLMFLGLGRDGHTASLFPHSPALDETTRWVVANPTGASVRITMTFRTFAHARHIRFLVAGRDKATVLARVLDGASSPLPAGRIAPHPGDLVWLVDAAAAT